MEGNISHLANVKPYSAHAGAVICRQSGSFTRIVHHFGDDTPRAWAMAEALNKLTLAACFASAGFARTL